MHKKFLRTIKISLLTGFLVATSATFSGPSEAMFSTLQEEASTNRARSLIRQCSDSAQHKGSHVYKGQEVSSAANCLGCELQNTFKRRADVVEAQLNQMVRAAQDEKAQSLLLLKKKSDSDLEEATLRKELLKLQIANQKTTTSPPTKK